MFLPSIFLAKNTCLDRLRGPSYDSHANTAICVGEPRISFNGPIG